MRSVAQQTVTPTTHDQTVAPSFGPIIALRLEDVTLDEALRAVSERAGLSITYSPSVLPAAAHVSLVADAIRASDAIDLFLRGTQLEAMVLAPGRITIRPTRGLTQVAGTIAGMVTDSITGGAIPYVSVQIEETGQSVTAGAQGRYSIADVAPGEYRVTARRVGFIARTRPVIVEDGQTATLDFKLNRPPTKLDEVVTTALGDQRRFEVGNSIATINVDSLVPTAPVTSVTDVLSSRVPGLQVREAGGLVGSGEAIRIRGQSSILLPGDPIIIVDGVRTDNRAGGTLSALFVAVPSPSRINDLDFSQIATIDVLRGPAATTEYGTDAANGVIVIKTKRGTAGRPQWSASAEQDGSAVPHAFPEYYYAWGHLTDGTSAPAQCPLVPIFGGSAAPSGPPFNTGVSFGTCAQDSVTHFNPLNNARTTMYGTGTSSRQDVSVGGGSETLRYHVGAGLSNAQGVIRLPTVFRAAALAAGFPASTLKPNSEDQRSINARMDIQLAPTAEVTVTSAYMSTYQSTPAGANLSDPVAGQGQPVLNDSAHHYGYSPPGDRSYTPLTQLGQQSNQQTNRLVAGMTAVWRASPWLTMSGNVGIDHGARNARQTYLPQVSVYVNGRDSSGELYAAQETDDIYSADGRASATLPVTHWMRLTTSVGMNYADTRAQGLAAVALGISTTNATLNGSTNPSVTQSSNRSASLGGYLDEQLAIADRFFVDGAARIDAGSGYGSAYRVALNPKLYFSYIALNSPSTVLRLRGALGAAGQQPPNGASLLLYYLSHSGWLDGGPVSTAFVVAVGNAHLQPERSQEIEGGTDAELFGGRVSVELNGYYRHTQHMLVETNLGFDLNQSPYVENIGEVRNTGVEAALSALVFRSWPLTWSVSVNGAINHNKLLRLDPGFQQQQVTEQQRQAAGYPLYGYWSRRLNYVDRNHDGIVAADEVTLTDSVAFMGSSLPTQTGTVSTHVGFFGSGVTIGASFDYAGGYKVFNGNAYNAARAGVYLPEQNVRGSPLWLQARAVASTAYYGCCSSFFEDGSYVRFRELSLTYSLPRRWIGRVRLTNLSITGAVRNLALWTRFTGPDPEVSNPGVDRIGSNNDIRSSGAQAVPLTRQWFVRLNLGL